MPISWVEAMLIKRKGWLLAFQSFFEAAVAAKPWEGALNHPTVAVVPW